MLRIPLTGTGRETQMTSQDDIENKSSKPFLEHLEDLRRTILWSVLSLAIGVGVAFPLVPAVLNLLKQPLRAAGEDPEKFLSVTTVGGGFFIMMDTALWTGILFSLPFIIAFIMHFVFPGLHRREQKGVINGLVAGVLLFIGGVVMCYFLILPATLKIMFGLNKWVEVNCPWVMIGDYAGFVLKMLIAFGLSFQLPVILVTLGALGLVTSRGLAKYRRHAAVVILIFAAFLTPPDVFSQVLMAGPMYLLYEICIWIVRARERKKGRSQESGVSGQ